MIRTERLLDTLIGAANLGMCVVDDRNKIIDVNEFFCAIYEYEREELINKSYSILQPESYRARASLYYQNYIEGHQKSGLRQIISKNGTRKNVYSFTANTVDEEGNKLKVFNVVEATEPSEISKEAPSTPLQTSTQEVVIGNNVKTGILRCSQEGELQYANPHARTLLFLPAGSKSLHNEVTVYKGQHSRKLTLVQLLNEERFVDNQSLLIERPDHPPFWAVLSASTTITDEGQVCFDITIVSLEDQKLLERKLNKRIEELKNSNKSLDHFVYGATHDLKAPLASISGLINILKREQDFSQRELYIQMMEKSVHRLNEFIKEIVDYSRNANQDLKHDHIEFQPLVEEIFESMAHLENAAKIRPVIQVEQDYPFLTDAHRLKVVLNNLVSNAYKYSSTHRRDCFIEVKVKVSPVKATIHVKDNGQGIGESHIEKIFDMFFRASEGQTGTGLGLYIVKETLDKMQGSIHVVSELGQGTSFVVNIPSASTFGSNEKQMKLDI
ncbi:PAS domain S-box-containing protein [Catalinimonas alkaloidigena]|uniref:PAS domain-containing sensor histidine kinase n=1 Tax=Catalinimonas alkaloidigena TaxID=1075417 RepID=UPI0024063810|nr:PAS domain-containing sensor histidine kinase [Catalinimonas alkaloidigena]MDF9795799.1 PAS domain S-box-containing protein [Catalinimonas alkaloidigena]